MSTDNRRGAPIMVHAVGAIMGALLVVRAVPVLIEAQNLNVPTLAGSYFVVALALLVSAAGVEVAARIRGYELSSYGVVALAAACAFALAIGNYPGLLGSTVVLRGAVLIFIAALAGLFSGPGRSAWARVATVLFCAAVGAAWQIAGAPLLAIAVVKK